MQQGDAELSKARILKKLKSHTMLRMTFTPAVQDSRRSTPIRDTKSHEEGDSDQKSRPKGTLR